MIRVPIQLQDESLIALRTLAKQEYRDVRQQAAWIIENELTKRGLLQTAEDPKKSEGDALSISKRECVTV